MGAVFLRSVAIGIALAVAAWLLLSLVAVTVPRAPMLAHLSDAFLTGSLTDQDYLSRDKVRGDSQFNDCVILSTAYLRSPSVFEDIASALWPIYINDQNTVCGELHRAVTTGLGPDETARYHRYLFGQRGVVALLLQFFSVDAIRWILLTLNHAVPVGLLVLGIAALRRSFHDATAAGVQFIQPSLPGPLLLLIGAMLLFFYGLVFFGQSVAHGLSDLLLSSFILFLAMRDLYAEPQWPRTLRALALLGGLTATFELFTGGLPMSVAALLLVYGVQGARQSSAATVIARALQGIAAFVICFATLVVLKIGIAFAVFGNDVVVDFNNQLLYRLGVQDELPRLQLTVQAFLNVLREGIGLFWGSRTLAAVVMLSAAIAALLASIRILRGTRRAPAELTAYALIVLSIAVVPVWYAVFPQHTLRHAWFMGRMLVWPIIGCFALWYVVFRLSLPSWIHSSSN